MSPNVKHELWQCSLRSPVGADTENERECRHHTSGGLALLVRLHHPKLWSLHVIMFQEHWAHKPGHVLLRSVCQNKSAVSNTVRLQFHFSLPRYRGAVMRWTCQQVSRLLICRLACAVIGKHLTSGESISDNRVVIFYHDSVRLAVCVSAKQKGQIFMKNQRTNQSPDRLRASRVENERAESVLVKIWKLRTIMTSRSEYVLGATLSHTTSLTLNSTSRKPTEVYSIFCAYKCWLAAAAILNCVAPKM